MRRHSRPGFYALVLAISMSVGVTWASTGYGIIVDLAKASQPLWIHAQKPVLENQAYMLRFAILPRQYTGSSKLEILFEWPADHLPGTISYDVGGSISNWAIEDYSYRSDNRFEIYLPALEKGRRAEVRLGWIGAPFDESRAYALLTTDNGQVVQQWTGCKWTTNTVSKRMIGNHQHAYLSGARVSD